MKGDGGFRGLEVDCADVFLAPEVQVCSFEWNGGYSQPSNHVIRFDGALFDALEFVDEHHLELGVEHVGDALGGRTLLFLGLLLLILVLLVIRDHLVHGGQGLFLAFQPLYLKLDAGGRFVVFTAERLLQAAL